MRTGILSWEYTNGETMPPLAPTTTPAGDYVRRLRDQYGDTQDEFAARIGSTQATVSRVEKGTGSYSRGISQEFAWKLVSRLGIDANEVAGYVDIPGWKCLVQITRHIAATSRTLVPATTPTLKVA